MLMLFLGMRTLYLLQKFDLLSKFTKVTDIHLFLYTLRLFKLLEPMPLFGNNSCLFDPQITLRVDVVVPSCSTWRSSSYVCNSIMSQICTQYYQ